MGIEWITSEREVEALAQRILSPRPRPLVLLSTAPGTDSVPLDAEGVHDAAGDVVDVVVIPTGDLSRGLEQLLPDRLQVFGGAGRSYPVDIGLDPDIRRSPLRMSNHRGSHDRLISDALAQAAASGAFHTTRTTAPERAGDVVGMVAGRAIVRLDGGPMATIWAETTFPSVPMEWALATGQHVRGRFDESSGRLLIDDRAPGDDRLRAAFPDSCVTLALVLTVDAEYAQLALHPARPSIVAAADVSPNPNDPLHALLSVGEVVRVRVTHRSTGAVRLTLHDVDDDEVVVTPLALVEGGLPWLVEGRELVELVAEPESLETTTSPVAVTAFPAASATTTAEALTIVAGRKTSRGAIQSLELSLAKEQARARELERRVSELGVDDSQLRRARAEADADRMRARESLAESAELREQLRASQRELRDLRARLRSTRSAPQVESPRSRATRWLHVEDWVRDEVRTAWAERVHATEKSAYPLPEYTIGPDFAASLEALNDATLLKALRAAVDVLIGRAHDIPGRDVHRLRDGFGGDDPSRVREDGARLMRAAIEQNTAGARRLHFALLPGGGGGTDQRGASRRDGVIMGADKRDVSAARSRGRRRIPTGRAYRSAG